VKIVKTNSFGLLELEMADLECFWRKTPLGPLGVKDHLLFTQANILFYFSKKEEEKPC
jgi:hypothetical protein